jgi:Tfp pilus assembly protein PilF
VKRALGRATTLARPAALASAALAWWPGFEAGTAKRWVALVVGAFSIAMSIATATWMSTWMSTRTSARLSTRVAQASASDPRGRRLSLSIRTALPLAAYCAWVCASAIWGTREGLRQVELVLGCVACSAPLLLGTAAQARRALANAAWIVGVGASLACLITWARSGSGYGVMGNPDWSGLSLALCLALNAEEVWTTRRWRTARWRWLACAVMIAALAVARSRVGEIALVGGLVAAAARRMWRVRGRKGEALTCGLALTPRFASDRAAYHDAPWRAALEDRLWIYRTSFDAGLTQPFGTGAGGFGRAFLDAQGERLGALSPQAAATRFVHAGHAHSSVLQTWVEQGVLGVVLLGWALVALLRRSWQLGGGRYLAPTVTAFVLGCGDAAWTLPSVALLLSWLAVVLVADHSAPAALAAPTSRPRWAALAVASLAALGWALRCATLTAISERALRLAEAEEPRASERRLREALHLAPEEGALRFALGLHALERGELVSAERHLLAAERDLADVGIRVALGNIAYVRGDDVEARRRFERAIAWHNGSLKAHVNVAYACLRQGDEPCAKTHLAAAKSIAPYHPKVASLEERVVLGGEAPSAPDPEDATP